VEEFLAATSGGFGGARVGTIVGADSSADAAVLEEESTEEGSTPLVSAEHTSLIHQSATSSSASNARSLEGSYFQVTISELGRSLGDDDEGSRAWPSCGRFERLENLDSDPVGSPCTSYTGPNNNMQLIPRRVREGPILEEVVPEEGREDTTTERELQQVRLVLCHIKTFCSSILKKLAPPLLREVESSSRLRAEAQSFTPRHLTRSAAMTVQEKGEKATKASVAETVLLKAMGIFPEELSVDEEHLASFNEIFDSPLGDRHVRVMASIFGKMVPQSFDQQEGCRVAVAAH
jgi:hypothetical protein